MKFYYFGIPLPGNWILDQAERIEAPRKVNHRLCDYCGEWISPTESGYAVALSASGSKLYAHNDCFLVSYGIIPSEEFQEDEGLTLREAADKAVAEALTPSRRWACGIDNKKEEGEL